MQDLWVENWARGRHKTVVIKDYQSLADNWWKILSNSYLFVLIFFQVCLKATFSYFQNMVVLCGGIELWNKSLRREKGEEEILEALIRRHDWSPKMEYMENCCQSYWSALIRFQKLMLICVWKLTLNFKL